MRRTKRSRQSTNQLQQRPLAALEKVRPPQLAASFITSAVGTKRTFGNVRPMSAFGGRSQLIDATLYLKGKRWSVGWNGGFTAAEKTELWDRWKRGESLKAIGRAFGKESSSIYFLVAPHGGFRPAERRRSRLALTLAEREVISRGVTARRSARFIAKLLGRSPSTVSREMNRNGGCQRHRATVAAPPARFSMILRLYWPEASVLSGAWSPPNIIRVN